MRTEIYGSQIVLKAYEASFIPMLFEAAIEARGGEFTRWMPWRHENYTMEESRTFVEKTVENRHDSEDIWRPDSQFGYAIFDSKAEKFLGGIGLNQPNAGHKFYNLGYWVRPSAQNRGIASRATRLPANAAFEDLPLNRIEILAAVENIPSRKRRKRQARTTKEFCENASLSAAEFTTRRFFRLSAKIFIIKPASRKFFYFC